MESSITAYILIGLLLLIMELDVRVLKRVDQDFFSEFFSISRLSLWTMCMALVLLAICVEPSHQGLMLGVIGGLLPFQLVQRDKFFKALKENSRELPRKTWFTLDAYGVILLWFLLTGIASFIIDSLFQYYPKGQGELWEILLSSIVASILMVVLIARASMRFDRGTFWKNVGFVRTRKPISLVIGLAILLAIFFAYLSVSVILSRSGQPVTPLSKLLESNESIGALLFFLLLAIMFAPLAEEIIFRGYFFEVLKRTKGKIWAVTVIALGFAGLHLGQYWSDWGAILMITLLGFVLTFLRLWSGTTLASTVMHYVYNASVTIIPLIMILTSNPAYFKYSMMYPQLNDITKEALLKESIQNQPNLSEAYNDLAWIYANQKKNLNQALDNINKALMLSPNVPEYLDTKAEVLFQLKRYDEALGISKDLLKKDIDEGLKDLQKKRIIQITELQDKEINFK